MATDPASPDRPVTVLFIAGQGRSGSTLLHNVLSQIDGFAGIGELREVWERGVIHNYLCGCGVPFRECPFWGQVMTRTFGSWDDIDPERWSAATESFRVHNLPLAVLPPYRRAKLRDLDDYLRMLGSLYTTIADVSGASVVIDSSKNPSFGWVVRHVPGIDVRFLHVVRDAPAVAHSWAQRKEFEAGRWMARKTPRRAALQWDAHNLGTELYLREDGPVQRLRYEDFIREPRRSLSGVMRWLDEEPTDLPLLDDGRVVLDEPAHSVFGNQNRFRSGAIDLKLDTRWRTEMDAGAIRTVKLFTQPLRARYGYVGATNQPTHEVSA